MMSSSISTRIPVALGLSVGVSLLLHCGYEELLYLMVQSASLFDLISTGYKLKSPLFDVLLIIVGSSVLVGNTLLLNLYRLSPQTLIEIVAITQVSDILQYLGGRQFGRTKIGGVSPNKTYEGYLISLTLLLLASPWFPPTRILLYWTLGILGGLVNSLVKRRLGIKDFSNLLGGHGGLIDRIDSIYFPSTLMYLSLLLA